MLRVRTSPRPMRHVSTERQVPASARPCRELWNEGVSSALFLAERTRATTLTAYKVIISVGDAEACVCFLTRVMRSIRVVRTRRSPAIVSVVKSWKRLSIDCLFEAGEFADLKVCLWCLGVTV